jgi:hypothetical protein
MLLGSIVTVAVAAVLVAGLGEPGRVDVGATAPLPTPSPTGACATVTTLGAAPGTTVAAYAQQAEKHLKCYATQSPDRRTYVLVSLRHYLTPDALARVFKGVRVVEAVAHVPTDKLPTQTYHPLLRHGLRDLPAQLKAFARIAQSTAKTYADLLANAPSKTVVQRKVREQYALVKRAVDEDAAALSHPATCRCVYAVVIDTGLLEIARLSRDPEVRVLDPATAGQPFESLVFLPLVPDVVGTVPLVGLIGG